MKLMIASSNHNKISEIISILNINKAFNWEFIPLPRIIEPEEPFSTMLENACYKAKYYGDITQNITLSEDTGFCVEALNHFPGVHTKQFVKSTGSFAQVFKNLEKMLQNHVNYSASYVSAVSLYIPKAEIILSYQAIEHGTLCFPPRGQEGFGFDSVFIPLGYQQTIAELGGDIKNRICHRAMAINGLLAKVSAEGVECV